jgi:hypothetical protein
MRIPPTNGREHGGPRHKLPWNQGEHCRRRRLKNGPANKRVGTWSGLPVCLSKRELSKPTGLIANIILHKLSAFVCVLLPMPLQMLFQETKRADAMNGVWAVKEFNFRSVPQGDCTITHA